MTRREVLPIPDPKHVGVTTFVATDPDTSYPPIEPLRPPEGAPERAGDPARRRRLRRVERVRRAVPARRRRSGSAAGGLKYTRFHTTALCSPTRAALLSGRNHHTVGMGAITEMATSAPGYNSLRPKTCAPLPEILKLNGYSTAQIGKCHEVPVFESSPIGPFDHWPNPGGGFEYFYGFIGGENNQWYPALYEQTSPVEPWGTPEEGYHLMADLADKAILWIRQQKSMAPDKPFFTYFAPGATHAPHHVPKEWADKYKGRFDAGWDALRDATFARQKALGVVPPECELTARPDEIPAWEDMDAELRPTLARQMEVYAGFLSYADHHVGRVIDALEDLGILEDTLVYYIIGDNGASGEGTLIGTTNEIMVSEAPDLATPEWLIERTDDLGTPDAYNHYAVGWAHAMDTPYQWTKQIASHWGGTRNGTIVHWPGGIAAKGEVRNQFHHVIDFAPTVLEAARVPFPTMVNGIDQEPLHGVSMSYCLRRRVRRGAPRDAVLRDDVQPRHLPQGLDRGHQARDPVGLLRSQPGRRRRRLGALRHDQGLVAGPRSRGRAAGQAGRSCSACSRSRRPSTTCSRSTRASPNASTPTSPAARRRCAATRSCSSAACTGCRRTWSSTSRTSRTPSRPRSIVPEDGARGVIIAPGRQHRRLVAVHARRPVALRLQLHRRPALLRLK